MAHDVSYSSLVIFFPRVFDIYWRENLIWVFFRNVIHYWKSNWYFSDICKIFTIKLCYQMEKQNEGSKATSSNAPTKKRRLITTKSERKQRSPKAVALMRPFVRDELIYRDFCRIFNKIQNFIPLHNSQRSLANCCHLQRKWRPSQRFIYARLPGPVPVCNRVKDGRSDSASAFSEAGFWPGGSFSLERCAYGAIVECQICWFFGFRMCVRSSWKFSVEFIRNDVWMEFYCMRYG